MSKRLRISGRVQGVGYRQWMCAEAERLGVSGWVRNRRDGSVEAVVDGPSEPLGLLIERTRRGPPAARVSGVEIEDTEGTFGGFEWRASA